MSVYIGIDWSVHKHDVCFMNEKGEVLQIGQIAHNVEGFTKLNKMREIMGVGVEMCVIGLETAHNLLVDFLWEQGYEQIYVIPPNAVKSAQGRYRQSRAKDDAWDARLIADLLRTDQNRYIVWHPDSELTRRIRAAVNMVDGITRELVRNGNRLRATLLRYYPVALELFSSLDASVTLTFIRANPTPQEASLLTFEEFKLFLRQNHHTQPKKWAKIYARLQQTYPQAAPAVIAAYMPQAVSFAKIMQVLVEEKLFWRRELNKLYAEHPDREIFASLPAAGEFLEPALLAKLGDDRQRYPTPKVLQAVAGTCPVTYQSGKRKSVHFRWACDHQFRKFVQQWANLTIEASPWAAAYYESVRPHCRTTNDAVRRLANRWLEIVWRLWHDHILYDETYHLQHNKVRSQPIAVK
jgi:transposase